MLIGHTYATPGPYFSDLSLIVDTVIVCCEPLKVAVIFCVSG